MNNKDASLSEQREWVLSQLQAQRQLVASKLESQSDAVVQFPRSMTMRVLMHRPSLLLRLLPLLMGARRAGSLLSVISLVQPMFGVVTNRPQAKALAAPRSPSRQLM